MSRVFKTRGFCHGFTWGTGRGTDFCTRQKPVPVARVDGFDPDFKLRSKSRETASSALEIVHFRPPQPPTTTQI
jgi:hypothetical protein